MFSPVPCNVTSPCSLTPCPVVNFSFTGILNMLHHRSSSTRILIALIFCINITIMYSQSEATCVAIPCTYIGECRDKFNVCGAGQSFCNSESLWLPACGGGGSLERPSSSGNDNENTDANDHNQSTPSPPTPQPTLRNTPNPTNRPTNRPTGGFPTLAPQVSSILSLPTPASIVSSAEASSSPTTAFEGWLSEQNGPKNEVDASTGNEDDGDYNPSNETWFDVAGWDDSRGKNEDTIIFWGKNESPVTRRVPCVLIGLTTIVHVIMGA
jgi:hypothetical protein